MAGSFGLYATAGQLKLKGHFARAAEKYGRAAAAAVQELAAEDCLVVAFLRATQAESLFCHIMAPALTAAEKEDLRQTVMSVLLPQCVSTLSRRKVAGTLMPGSCRAAEMAWFRTSITRKFHQDGVSDETARNCGEALAPMLGYDAYLFAASAALTLLMLSLKEPPGTFQYLQLTHAAFVTSAFELMAQPRELCYAVMDGVNKVLRSPPEETLVHFARQLLLDEDMCSFLDDNGLSLMTDAWRRVERSGVIAMRMLRTDLMMTSSIAGRLDAAAAEAAVRGLRGCALAGCASKEIHVSQFKRCGACQQAFYCCREHQLADWPSHKAACKAARKAAAQSSK